MTLPEFVDWFSQLYQDLTGQVATGTPEEWQARYRRMREAFDPTRQHEERRP
jgi:hypothetical protein